MRGLVVHASVIALVLPACFDPDPSPFEGPGSTGPTTQGGSESTGDASTTADSGLDTADDSATSGPGPDPDCGNGVRERDEECDDGNDDDTDDCLATCVAARCGDGVVWAGQEDCDDAGESATCTVECATSTCGDGVLNTTAGEVCDDGNDVSTDACVGGCVAASCGDGLVWEGQEACDDGNDGNDTNGCLDGCILPACGDGRVAADEACDDGNANEADGCLSTCALARTCGQIQAELGGAGTDGIHLIDPDAEGPLAPFDAYCDMTTDGGGWTLLTWVGDPSQGNRGLPYPGLAHCPGLACGRGSGVAPANIPALLSSSTAFALAHSPGIMPSYATIGGYTYAGRYDYGDLTGLAPVYASTSCGPQPPFAQGTFTSLVGPPDYDGAAVFISHGFTYGAYDYTLDTNPYIWSIGVTANYCNGTGEMPGTYFGTWFNPSTEYGPYLPITGGARSVWVR